MVTGVKISQGCRLRLCSCSGVLNMDTFKSQFPLFKDWSWHNVNVKLCFLGHKIIKALGLIHLYKNTTNSLRMSMFLFWWCRVVTFNINFHKNTRGNIIIKSNTGWIDFIEEFSLFLKKPTCLFQQDYEELYPTVSGKCVRTDALEAQDSNFPEVSFHIISPACF